MKKIICYDLHGISDNAVYTKVREDIEKQYPKSVYILNTTYLIYTSDSMNAIFDNIKAILTKHAGSSNFEFSTSKYSDEKGWLNKSKWTEINHTLKSSLYH